MLLISAHQKVNQYQFKSSAAVECHLSPCPIEITHTTSRKHCGHENSLTIMDLVNCNASGQSSGGAGFERQVKTVKGSFTQRPFVQYSSLQVQKVAITVSR